MTERVTRAQRIEGHIVAEREVMRYADDHALWHKHVHNVELDAVQVLKMIEMDEHPNTIDFSSRRTGKTSAKELYGLKHNACNADQELGIVAPREAQSLTNLDYHLEAIRRSPILTAFLDYRAGRAQFSDTSYQFANRSSAGAYGIMAQVDGGDLTTASLEEVDDMPKDRLYSRFLLMLGANRRLGAAKESRNAPQIRITGVFKGADTLQEMIDSGKYHLLPTVDAYLGIEMGILNEQFILDMRDQLTPDEYLRQLLCRNVSARNLIWEKYVRRAMQVGLKAGIQVAEPLPGAHYKKRGLIGFGYDHSGHGEEPHASRYACVVTELVGNFACFVYARTWPPGTDETIVKNDLKSLWRYFRPDYGMGDAFGIGLLTTLNDELFSEGLIDVDRSLIGEGQSTDSTWQEWAFAPTRFEGSRKHSMAQALRSVFHNGNAAVPYFDDYDVKDTGLAGLPAIRLLVRQLTNIRPETIKAAYQSYKMVNSKLGDDLFDAAMASVWSLVVRGAAPAPAAIHVRSTTRDALLAQTNKPRETA